MRVFLVRHGESMGNVDKSVHLHTPDHAIPLSDRGHRQTAAAGKVLHDLFAAERDRSWTQFGRWNGQPRLWVSPYLRTRQTADAIQKAMGRTLRDRKEHPLLCEQQFGLFDGIPDEELPDHYPAEHAHYQKHENFEGRFWARMPLGESRFDVAVRVHQSFGTFHRDNDKHGINDIIVVCHGVTMRAFQMMWCHLTPEWFDAEPNPQNCSIRLIEDGEDKGYIHEGAIP